LPPVSAPAPSDHRLPLPRLVAFATPGLPIGALAIALAVFLPRYYASHFGLGLAVVGGAFGIVRLIDMLFDPFIGVAMDHTMTRIGRYRPWLLLGAPVLMLAVYMLFIPPVKPDAVWLIGWLFVYYLGTSLITLAHISWASVVAAKYHERSRVFGAIQVVTVIGSAGVLLLPALMERSLGPHASAAPAMGWFVIIVAPLGVLLASGMTRERIVREDHGEKVTLKDYWDMVSRPDMRRIIIADFCLMMGPGWMSALYLFYFRSVRGFTVSQASVFLLLYIASGIVGAALVSRIAQRFGKHRTQMASCVLYSLGLSSLFILPNTTLAVSSLFLLLGLVSQSFILLDRAMIADVGDAIRLETGHHKIGLLFGCITTAQKIAQGLSIIASFMILSWVGFNPEEGAVNTPAAIDGLRLVYLIGPVAFVMLGAACYIGYKLDDTAHGKIRAALELRDAAAAPQAAE
jgi:GPH family glycoside/pentoside/hexuronide:cation symporter